MYYLKAMIKRLHTPSVNAKFFFFSLLVHLLLMALLFNLSFKPSSEVNKIIVVDLGPEGSLLSENKEQRKAQSKNLLPKRETLKGKAQSKASIFPKNEPLQREDERKESLSEVPSLGIGEARELPLSSTTALKEGTPELGSEGSMEVEGSKEVEASKEVEGSKEVGSSKKVGDSKKVESAKKVESEAEGGAEELSKTQLSVISRLVREHLEYPYLARRMGWEGEVLLGFRLSLSGEVEDLKVLKSSGFEVLDQSALKAVKRASKHFPRPKHTVLVKLPVRFKLEK